MRLTRPKPRLLGRGSGFLVPLLFAACGPTPPTAEDRAAQGDVSVLTVPLPTPFLSGYAQDIQGEILTYHSPVPTVETSLLVRSEDRDRSIGWESEVVPTEVTEEGAVFVLMLGIDVHDTPRTFEFLVDGLPAFQIQNPRSAAVGDTIRWEGESGIEGSFHVTLIDRYGDAMGFLFLEVPRNQLEPGEPVRFEVLGETAGARTWFMIFRDPVRPGLTIRNAPAVLRSPEGELQALRMDLLTLREGEAFHLDSPVGQVDTVVPMGHTRFTLPVPAVASPQEVVLSLGLGAHQDRVSYTVTPPRRIEIHLLHHTHLDIGYTHHQNEVERMQWGHLEEALRLGEASTGYPEGSRFIWHPEGIWPVESYVRAHPGEKTEKLMEGIRRGWIELDGMYAGLLTGLANEETLLHAFDAGRTLAEMSGVPIESEMVSDIPGFSWGMVEAMAANGIRYLSIGPNFGHRIGHLTEELGDRPFYWEGPSGESRVLTWVSGGGYAWFHTGLGYDTITALLDEEKVFRFVDQMVRSGYPYDITYLRYNIGSDNGPPDPRLAQAVVAWNEKYASPVLRISGTTEVFREFERRHGEELPTYRGDMTGHWEDGAGSSARETAMVRRVAEALPQMEALAEMRGVALDEEILEEAWRNVLLFYEHTWGSWNSISEPYADLTVTSWERKKGFAERAAVLSDQLRASVLFEPSDAGVLESTEGEPRETGAGSGEPGSTLGENTPTVSLEVINTLAWPRTDLVALPPIRSSVGDRVLDEAGEPVPSQRLSTGELGFLAMDVPANGTKRFWVVKGEAYSPFAANGFVGTDALTTSVLSARVDTTTGTIISLVHRPSNRELVSSGGAGLNQYLYVPGRDPADVVMAGSATLRALENGPLVMSLEATAPAPGLRGPFRTEIRVVEGLHRIDITNYLAKEWVLDPEAVLFRFPFGLTDPEVWIDAPFGAYRPEKDQVPGASMNYFSVQRWVDLSDGEGGVTVSTVDAPLIQLGEIRTDPIVTGWLDTAEPSGTLFSYVMNNYWETNYRAAQNDDVRFEYSLRPHDGFDETAAKRFGLERARPLVVRFPPS